jgi:hypothetical protein
MDMDRGQREGMGVPSVPLSHHVPGEYADRRARVNGGLCTPADHGAGTEAAVIYIGEVVSKGGPRRELGKRLERLRGGD